MPDLEDVLLEKLKTRKAELLDKFRNGDQEAFNEMTKDYQDKVQRKAQNMVHDFEEARDIVQELLIRMYRCKFRGSKGDIPADKVCSYISRTLANLCIDHLRRRKILTVGGEVDFSGVGQNGMMVTILELIEEAEQVIQLANLEDDELQAFRCYSVDNLNFRETSERLGVSEKKPSVFIKKRKKNYKKFAVNNGVVFSGTYSKNLARF